MKATANSGGAVTAGKSREKETATRKWGGFPTFQALLDNGTPRQKAEAWTTGYWHFTYGDPETVTADQADMIDRSVMWPERDEFDRYRATAKAYEQVHKTVKMALLYFREAREKALGIYRLYKELEQTQDTLDRILKRVRGLRLKAEQQQEVRTLIVESERIRRKDRATARKDLQAAVKEAGECLEDLKGIATAVEEFASRTRTKGLMPDVLREALKEARRDRVRETEPMFSRAEKEAREANGEDTAGMDLAIFPDWEHTIPSRRLYIVWSQDIRALVEDHIKLLQ